MTQCDCCAVAQVNPRTGLFRKDCQECRARALAQGMEFFLSQRAGRMTPEYRAALDEGFKDDAAGGHDRVKAWARRIKGD
jgi:hypothetical protein